ncbi:MAG: UDP-N-acetylmuramoyl-L-alanyl-D-glutamate--2,6-diaminopimelate ligase [Alphaproteobacteria bacterium ADurb.Bin438]|nr:MAG: UDP-N-acetylmuramoyl-L-alanyl-D-glutamate--2,6-diaminopimelate ligase [Alphaproteobacteria bacterium ADurb.Bin438]
MHKIINDITIQGCTHLALEVSSHAIDLHRTSSLRFDKVGFTNLSPDHLDYHKSMEDYLNTKLKLFNNDLPAVVNADIPEFEKIKAISRGRVLSYGKNGEDLKILSRIAKETGQEIEALIFGKKYQLNLNVIGDFQAMNLLLAIGLASINNRNVLENLEDIVPLLKAPDGRIDFVASLKNGASVYVDYAHTPDALEKLLKALKPHASNKLAVVFGCGGDRDKTKRPIMGKISNDLADVAYVTDDNPRTEDASEIRKEIMETATKATEIGNRKDAIEMAIANLEAGDILVIAGKGHETGQTIGKVVHDFNDKKIALEYITDKGL